MSTTVYDNKGIVVSHYTGPERGEGSSRRRWVIINRSRWAVEQGVDRAVDLSEAQWEALGGVIDLLREDEAHEIDG